jgi:hypothetical protein
VKINEDVGDDTSAYEEEDGINLVHKILFSPDGDYNFTLTACININAVPRDDDLFYEDRSESF